MQLPEQNRIVQNSKERNTQKKLYADQKGGFLNVGHLYMIRIFRK